MDEYNFGAQKWCDDRIYILSIDKVVIFVSLVLLQSIDFHFVNVSFFSKELELSLGVNFVPFANPDTNSQLSCRPLVPRPRAGF